MLRLLAFRERAAASDQARRWSASDANSASDAYSASDADATADANSTGDVHGFSFRIALYTQSEIEDDSRIGGKFSGTHPIGARM